MLLTKVLIIDDEMDSCLLLKSFLTQLKYDVYTALTLADGLLLIEQVSPAIIFLDNNLPDGLGCDQIDHIQLKCPQCKIILISAYHYDEKRLSNKDIRVFEKPISLSMIKNYLA